MRLALALSSRLVLFTCLATLLSVRYAWTASTPALTVSELVRMAPLIVHGTVTETQSRWNEDHSLIVTEARVLVSETLRGQRRSEVTVVQPGGRVGKLRVDVDGAVAVLPGQEVVLFLAPGSGGGWTPIGLACGTYSVETEQSSGRKRIKAAGAASQSIDLDHFLTDVRQKVRALPRDGER